MLCPLCHCARLSFGTHRLYIWSVPCSAYVLPERRPTCLAVTLQSLPSSRPTSFFLFSLIRPASLPDTTCSYCLLLCTTNGLVLTWLLFSLYVVWLSCWMSNTFSYPWTTRTLMSSHVDLYWCYTWRLCHLSSVTIGVTPGGYVTCLV